MIEPEQEQRLRRLGRAVDGAGRPPTLAELRTRGRLERRRRARRRSAVAVICVMLVGTVGVGLAVGRPRRSMPVHTGQGPGGAVPSGRLPALLDDSMAGRLGGFTVLAASGHQLLAAGGTDPGPDGSRVTRDHVVLVDLADGRGRRVEVPRVGAVSLDVQGAVGTDDGFVVFGRRCEERKEDGDGSCRPETPASFRLAADGTWRPLTSPTAWNQRSIVWRFQRLQAVGSDGAVITAGPAVATGQQHVFLLEGSAWRDLGRATRRSDDQIDQACATADALYVVPATRTGRVRAAIDVLRFSGERASMRLPELPNGIFGVMEGQLGCGPDGPVLFGSLPGVEPVARWWDGDRWRDLHPDGFPADTLAGDGFVNGGRSTLLRARGIDVAGDGGPRRDYAILRGGAIRTVRGTDGTRTRTLWLGSSSRLLVVRPAKGGASYRTVDVGALPPPRPPAPPTTRPDSLTSGPSPGVTTTPVALDAAWVQAVARRAQPFEPRSATSWRADGASYDQLELARPDSPQVLEVDVFQHFDRDELDQDGPATEVAGGSLWLGATEPELTSVYFLSSDEVGLRVALRHPASVPTELALGQLRLLARVIADEPAVRSQAGR